MTNRVGILGPYLSLVENIVERSPSSLVYLLTTEHNGWPRGTSESALRTTGTLDPMATGEIEYVVWSDVFLCPECSARLIYWDLAFRGPGKHSANPIRCTNCQVLLTERTLERAWQVVRDPELNKSVSQAVQVPVLINYRFGGRRFEKSPDERDFDLLEISPHFLWIILCPLLQCRKGSTRPSLPHRTALRMCITSSVDAIRYFLARSRKAVLQLEDPIARNTGLYVLTGAVQRVCRLNRYMPNHDRHVGPLSGTLYVVPLLVEIPATNYLRSRIDDLRRCMSTVDGSGVLISTQKRYRPSKSSFGIS